jgi:hypothetical protein
MSTPPTWLETGRDFYKHAFEHRTRGRLDRSIEDWQQLSPAEQSFIHSHLLYLNLLAQGDQLALLEDIRDLLAEQQLLQEQLLETWTGASDPGEDLGDIEDYPAESEGYDEDYFEDSEQSFFPEEELDDDPTGDASPLDEPVVIDVPSEVVSTEEAS